MAEQQQQPQAQIFSTSVKISQTAKGQATVDVHVYDNDDGRAMARAVELYHNTIKSLQERGLPVAMEASK